MLLVGRICHVVSLLCLRLVLFRLSVGQSYQESKHTVTWLLLLWIVRALGKRETTIFFLYEFSGVGN